MSKPTLPPKTGHGGPRKPGPGKKLGRPRTGKGRTVKNASISMPPKAWEHFDDMRGSLSRGAFLVKKLKLKIE